MTSLRAVALALIGGTMGAVGLSTLVVGCGGDDTGSDSGLSPDATSEGGGSEDATQDTGHAETGTDAKEGGASSASDAGDAGHDADAAAAHDADAGPKEDAAEAGGDAEAGPTTTPLQQYAMAYAVAYCQGYLHCCDGYDAGAINVGQCATDLYAQASQENTLPLPVSLYTSPHLAVNEDASAGCFGALSNLACLISAADNAAATNPCFGVITGNIPVGGGGCSSSFECAAGYCSLPDDGGTGTCTSLVADGGPCLLQEMCSQIQLQPTSYCTSVDDGGGPGICAPLLPDNSICNSDMQCIAEFCFNAGGTECGGTGIMNTSTGYCETYAVVVDAGADADAGD